jgi:hypothetical protein
MSTKKEKEAAGPKSRIDPAAADRKRKEHEPGKGRKVLFALLMALGAVLIIEFFALLGLWFLEGRIFTSVWAKTERERAQGQARELSNPLQTIAMGEKENPFSTKGQIVHPYVGYVLDPDREDLPWPINPLGFFATPRPLGSQDPPLQIGVFGGSVANLFVRHGRERLIEVLRSSPLFSQRQIWVRSFAIGGFKQPQQQQTLSYLLAIGEDLELVINLDGFNDIATAPEEHRESGLSPWYPRGWPSRVAGLPDTDSLRLAGEVAFLEGRRARRAGVCGGHFLARSPTCYLLWKLDERRTRRRVDDLRRALTERQGEDGGFRSLGPAWRGEGPAHMLARLAEVWGRASLLMDQSSRAFGRRYFHFLQPNQYVPGAKPMGRRERRLAFDPKSPRGESVRQGYPLLARVGAELRDQGVRFHDLQMIFAQENEPLYEDRCCHLNQRGNDLLAEEIARTVIADYAAFPD